MFDCNEYILLHRNRSVRTFLYVLYCTYTEINLKRLQVSQVYLNLVTVVVAFFTVTVLYYVFLKIIFKSTLFFKGTLLRAV